MSITDHGDFDKMMDTVRILRGHYSVVANAAEQEMLKARIRGDRTTADAYKAKLREMSSDHDTALSLIADHLTTPAELRATRRELRTAADTAHDFVKDLRTAKMTLDKLTKAAGFLTTLVTELRGIFGV